MRAAKSKHFGAGASKVASPAFGRKQESAKNEIAVPILCKFWLEDAVWNGIAADLAVAAFGSSFEEARDNLATALVSHFESVQEAGKIEQLIALLQEKARDYLPFAEVSPDSPLVKMLVAIKDDEVFSLTPA